ncbi:MAG: aspartyl protease family protein [Myxococcota bacterium]
MRTAENGERIYIEADLGDGVPRFFMVDTGSSVTTLTRDVAESLELQLTQKGGWLTGISGRSPHIAGVIDEVRLGRFVLEDVEVAVDVVGVPQSAGAVPLAGLMGNNVWQHFVLELDYPAGVMALHRPGGVEMPETSTPIVFDGQHINTSAIIEIKDDDEIINQPLVTKVDTGAGGLLLSGSAGEQLDAIASYGVEPIFGIGSGDDLPLSNFLRETRRLNVGAINIGGARIERDLHATLLELQPNQSMGNLLGHNVLDGYRVLFDYRGQKMALIPSQRTAAVPNIHHRYLAWLKKQRDTQDIVYQKIDVSIWTDQLDEARDLLETYHRRNPEDARATVMLSRFLRHDGDIDGAMALTESLSIEDQVKFGAIVGLVNSLWLSGDTQKGLEVAQTAVRAQPERSLSWLALADARRATGDLIGARAALKQVNLLEQNPDGHLLRRAWVASEEGDHYAALTHIRRLIQLYPNGAVAPWFYAMQVEGTPQTDLFLEDVERALNRLHPGDGPLDFLAGAYQVVGADSVADRLMNEGLDRDCVLMEDPDSRENCEAWYHALTHQQLDKAYALIAQAVENQPNRSEFLDTLAVVQEARGEIKQASDAAWQAAILSPDDVYMLWQAARLQRAALADGS